MASASEYLSRDHGGHVVIARTCSQRSPRGLRRRLETARRVAAGVPSKSTRAMLKAFVSVIWERRPERTGAGNPRTVTWRLCAAFYDRLVSISVNPRCPQ